MINLIPKEEKKQMAKGFYYRLLILLCGKVLKKVKRGIARGVREGRVGILNVQL